MRKGPVDLSGMDRRFFVALSPEARVELHALAIEQAEKLEQDSTNSSRPPSSGGPFGPASGTSTGVAPPPPSASPPAPDPSARSGRKPGKQRGSKGIWRCEPLQAERDENHYPTLCAACATPFEIGTAITAFVTNPDLPATNNEAERALRDAVIARRISNGTRSEERSAAYAATLSVVETCRRRGIEPWRYITDLLARARKGMPHITIPLSV